MAYQAAALPINNQPTMYDYGVRIGSWVSAFEILAHPGEGQSNLNTVLDLLDEVSWGLPRVGHRRYVIKYKKKKRNVPLALELYKQIYDARNDFVHGNPVALSRLFPFGEESRSVLTAYAPLLYGLALASFLGHWKKEYDIDLHDQASIRSYFEHTGWQRPMERALLTAVDENETETSNR
jgi:hypothetical protein